MVGQIASALLEVDAAEFSRLLPATLGRLRRDLNRESQAKTWLRSAAEHARSVSLKGVKKSRSRSINNPYGTHGRAVRNPYARSQSSPVLIGEDGTYLGRLNSNRYDPESTSNPYGVYGSRYSSKSINNPYGRYGSRYSPQSARNPYATKAPRLFVPSFESRALDLLKKRSP